MSHWDASSLGLLAASGWVLHVLVPVLLGLLVLAAVWIGVRWVGSEHVELVRSVRLFRGLSDGQLRSVLRSAREVEFSPGETIVTEGTPGSSFFVIRRGTARITVGGNELAKLGAGSYFGELALIDEGPRTATVAAETHTVTTEVPSSGFSRLLDADPGATRAISLELREWLSAAGEAIPEPTDGPVGRPALVALCQRLRAVQGVDWAEGRAPTRRWPWARR